MFLEERFDPIRSLRNRLDEGGPVVSDLSNFGRDRKAARLSEPIFAREKEGFTNPDQAFPSVNPPYHLSHPPNPSPPLNPTTYSLPPTPSRHKAFDHVTT